MIEKKYFIKDNYLIFLMKLVINTFFTGKYLIPILKNSKNQVRNPQSLKWKTMGAWGTMTN